jgi:RNA polymerase sigma factor (sigma-70 family)
LCTDPSCGFGNERARAPRVIDLAHRFPIPRKEGCATMRSGKIAPVIGGDERRELDREYREHVDWLRSAARRRVGSRHAAEDLVQEAFLRASRYPASERNPRPLLVRILSNLIKDRFRASTREAKALSSVSSGMIAEGACAPDQVETIVLNDIILSMPKSLRDVFVLARFTPMTQPEIAVRLGISIKTVEWRLAKALEYCVSQLGE